MSAGALQRIIELELEGFLEVIVPQHLFCIVAARTGDNILEWSAATSSIATSYDLDTMPLLMQPKTALPLLVAVAHCWLMINLWSTNTQILLKSTTVLLSQVLPIWYL